MRWERDVPLGALARYRIGGPARELARPGSVAELREALGEVEGREHRVLGTGANVLISETGFRGPVLILGGGLDHLRMVDNAIEAGAAARLPALAGAARKEGREGFHFLEAVPGTIGGGLRMNAGSRDDWLWHHVEWAEAIGPEGELLRWTPDDASPTYRAIEVPEEWVFVGARFVASPGDPEAIQEAHLGFRRQKVHDQVYELPSVGSTWKNPGAPHPSAWQIVADVGMRGVRIGGAQIARRHANFIVNLGGARADDVLELMIETRRRARESFGLSLEPEIRFWGFEPDRLAEVGA